MRRRIEDGLCEPETTRAAGGRALRAGLAALAMLAVLAALVAAAGGPGGLGGLAVHEAKADGTSEPRAVVLRQLLRQQARLWNLSEPMLAESAEICGVRTRASYGFVAWTRWDIDRRYRIASMGAYGLDDRLRVVHVLPGSPAAAAGLLAGDEIEKVAGHDMPSGRAAGAALALALQREAAVGRAQSFRIRRGGERLTLRIAPRRHCDLDLIVVDSDRVNAVNLDRSIYVTMGLMRRFSDNRELAAVIAHFVGHGLLEHGPGSDEQSFADSLATQADALKRAALGESAGDYMIETGSLPGFRPYAAKQEIQADRAALEILARAGYDMAALVEVWRRLAERDPGAAPLADFHPPSAQRRAAAEDILSQVRGPSAATVPGPGS